MSTQKSINQNATRLGVCPHCQTTIASVDILIEYETGDGQPKVWTECPCCHEVVHPE
ncbi:hypothetical protein [Haloarcula sp. JP-L23]|uniref:DUF7837 family putative zinc-binding protein n=1 Tax=Haloarcula sp. JP-L23 TaxID=2716717 RepID=UPI00140F1E64|nr:hypothetical protein G9465_18440 [Haloarcula sp. JP-L23]